MILENNDFQRRVCSRCKLLYIIYIITGNITLDNASITVYFKSFWKYSVIFQMRHFIENFRFFNYSLICFEVSYVLNSSVVRVKTYYDFKGRCVNYTGNLTLCTNLLIPKHFPFKIKKHIFLSTTLKIIACTTKFQ